MTMHDDEIAVDDDAARTLIATQFPHWATAPVQRVVSAGTVNSIFRIGEDHAARFPLLGTDPGQTRRLLEAEAQASAEFARASPFRSPTPIGLGRPGAGYPLPWSVQTWIHGTDATGNDPPQQRSIRPRPRPADRRSARRRHPWPDLFRGGSRRSAASPRRMGRGVPAPQWPVARRAPPRRRVGTLAGAAGHRRRRDEPRGPHPRQPARR